MCMHTPMESRGIVSPDAIVTGSCELPDVGSDIKLESSGRAVCS